MQTDLLLLTTLRTAPAYQAAESARRDRGAANMVSNGAGKSDQAAIRLLIGTWDAIASAVLTGGLDQELVFQTQPLYQMWTQLEPAIKALRNDPNLGSSYAEDFENLCKALDGWLQSKGPAYVTKGHSGIHGFFG